MMGNSGTTAGRKVAKRVLAVALIAATAVITGLSARTTPTPPAPTAAPKMAVAAQAKPLPAAAQPDSGYPIKGVLTLDGPLKHGSYAWNDEGAPMGEILITVDLKAETLSIFRGGYEIGVAAILYGANNKPTPLGAFPILQKSKDHVSNLYDAPMPYMLRLTNDGVAIHGSEVEWGAATHGCIGVPTAFARLLFEQVRLGDRVLITNGQMLELGDAVPAA